MHADRSLMDLRRYRGVFFLLTTALLPAGGLAQRSVAVWLTTADQAKLLAPQTPLPWRLASADNTAGAAGAIVVDDAQTFQTMDGFGHTLTGGSAQLLRKMSPATRTALLRELFGSGPNDIHTSYLRVTVGASDMNDHVYTYDDQPAGEADPALAHFSLAADETDVIPVLREIVAIEPTIKILASAWTAPAWMKDNDAVKGGHLKPELYDTYARYWVMYLKGMQARGIRIDALTPQNEPENPQNTPSLVMTADEEAAFIGKHLGPAIAAAGLKTKIIAFDHNCDHPVYSETVLGDPEAARYTDGAGFHLYRGEITALTTVHDAFPNKNIYFTEQMVVPRFDAVIARPVARLIIGAPANWSRNVLLWNLAADPQNGPHTADGGCPVCAGAITLDGDRVTRLVAYYVAAHASKFVPPGSVRIGSSGAGSGTGEDGLAYVAFRTPAHGHVLIVSNPGTVERDVRIRSGAREASTTLAAGAVASYVW